MQSENIFYKIDEKNSIQCFHLNLFLVIMTFFRWSLCVCVCVWIDRLLARYSVLVDV